VRLSELSAFVIKELEPQRFCEKPMKVCQLSRFYTLTLRGILLNKHS